MLSRQLKLAVQHGALVTSIAMGGAVQDSQMKSLAWIVIGAVAAAAAPAAMAEPLPPPLEPAPVAAQPAEDPGFANDVEHALDDLTRLQCGLLGLILINSQPCPVP